MDPGAVNMRGANEIIIHKSELSSEVRHKVRLTLITAIFSNTDGVFVGLWGWAQLGRTADLFWECLQSDLVRHVRVITVTQ